MIIVLKDTATDEQTQTIIHRIEELGMKVHRSVGVRRTVLGVVAAQVELDSEMIEVLPGVDSVHRITSPTNPRKTCDAVETYLRTCKLTRRERELVQLLLDGYCNKDVARRWDITEWTVKDHMKSIYKKLGVHQRAALIAHLLRLRESSMLAELQDRATGVIDS